jgi:uncharacterized protein (TIGR02391 family)
MSKLWRAFERIARNAARFTDAPPVAEAAHPFEVRNIHSALPAEVKRLFDNAHYPQATFEAFKFLDNEVKRHSGVDKTGKALMMEAIREVSPLVQLTPLANETDRSEQEGYKFIFAGSMMAIRNPRGHQHSVSDDIDTCLDHLTLVSQLLRRLAQAGFPTL